MTFHQAMRELERDERFNIVRRHRNGAVAVGVGLDHRQDFAFRPDVAPNDVEVLFQSWEGNLRPAAGLCHGVLWFSLPADPLPSVAVA